MRYVLFALAFVIVVLFLGQMTGQPLQGPRVNDGFIASGHYVVVEDKPSGGDTLYVGSVDGKSSLAFHSKGGLWNPFIVDSNRVLVVEAIDGPGLNFRLLDIHFVGTSISCRRLVESKQYIGYPIVPHGRRSDEVWFFSGEFNPDAAGIPVHKHQLTVVKDGKVNLFDGPTFLTIGRPAQIEGQRFLAPSPIIQFDATNVADLIDKTWLVDIQVDGMKINARPVGFLKSPITNVSGVSSQMEGGDVFVLSYLFENGVQGYVHHISLSGKDHMETSYLPQMRNYSGVFSDSLEDGRITMQILSVDENIKGKDGVLMISDFVDGRLVNDRQIKLEAGKEFYTTDCSSTEVTF